LGAGKTIKLGVIREGKEKTYEVTLGEATNAKTKADNLHHGLQGAELSNTTASDPIEGVKVTSVAKDSPAASYQLQTDDIIIGVNRQRVKNIADLRAIMDKNPSILALNIQRGDRTIYLVVR
jgi:serine protease Do/serine protease DegQ